jgi:hypothetical protein
MRRLAALLALALMLSLAAPALAGYPKRGVYIDTKLQVYVTVGKSRTSITALNAPCVRPAADGTLQGYGAFTLPKSKHPKIGSNGKFSYKGNVTLTTTEKAVVPVEVKGKFANGKLKGTVDLDPRKSGCAAYSFSGKNYGVNPQG